MIDDHCPMPEGFDINADGSASYQMAMNGEEKNIDMTNKKANQRANQNTKNKFLQLKRRQKKNNSNHSKKRKDESTISEPQLNTKNTTKSK